MAGEIMPPAMGAAVRFITSEPVPVPHGMGSGPAANAAISQGGSVG